MNRHHSEFTGIAGVVLRIVGAALSLPFKFTKSKKK